MDDGLSGVAGPVVTTSERALFTVPIWTSSVPPDTWWISRLIDDITRALEMEPQDPASSSGHQTQAVLQNRAEEHWQEFLRFTTSAFEAAASTAPRQRYQRFFLRSWGLRVNAVSSAKDLDFGPSRTLARHNHSPALLTSVFACELPQHPEAAKLPTVFHNPAQHMNCPWQPSIMSVSPKVGTLLIFPGWLEHSVPIVAPIPVGQQRITINTDYFPEF
jgi:hypothetical protein